MQEEQIKRRVFLSVTSKSRSCYQCAVFPDSLGRLDSAALIDNNIQQITILPACNESDGEMGSAKSFSLSD